MTKNVFLLNTHQHKEPVRSIKVNIETKPAKLITQVAVFYKAIQDGFCTYIGLEIKPCQLGSRIQDMEAEWRLKVIADLISW